VAWNHAFSSWFCRICSGWPNGFMRRERPDHSLEPTALLNEAYCRLVGSRERDWENRRHFFAVAARAMRCLLIDHARRRAKAQEVSVEAWKNGCAGARISSISPSPWTACWMRWKPAIGIGCSIIELKYFMGFSDEETAEALGLPLRSMQRKFGDARRWLYERMEPRPCPANKNTMSS